MERRSKSQLDDADKVSEALQNVITYTAQGDKEKAKEAYDTAIKELEGVCYGGKIRFGIFDKLDSPTKYLEKIESKIGYSSHQKDVAKLETIITSWTKFVSTHRGHVKCVFVSAHRGHFSKNRNQIIPFP